MKTIQLKRLKVDGANAVSAPYVIGLPSITAFMGATHLLEKLLKGLGFEELKIEGLGIVCHDLNVGTYKGSKSYVYSIIGQRQPLKKDGKNAPIIEKAKCNMTISLVMTFSGIDSDLYEHMEEMIKKLLMTKIRLAGGIIRPISLNQVRVRDIIDDKDFCRLKAGLMPGFTLLDRSDLVKKAVKEKGLDQLDAILDSIKVKHRCVKTTDELENDFEWVSYRENPERIVPICIGYHGISEVKKVENQRTYEYDHQFVESVLSLGEFKIVSTVSNIETIIWKYNKEQEKNNLYLYGTKI